MFAASYGVQLLVLSTLVFAAGKSKLNLESPYPKLQAMADRKELPHIHSSHFMFIGLLQRAVVGNDLESYHLIKKMDCLKDYIWDSDLFELAGMYAGVPMIEAVFTHPFLKEHAMYGPSVIHKTVEAKRDFPALYAVLKGYTLGLTIQDYCKKEINLIRLINDPMTTEVDKALKIAEALEFPDVILYMQQSLDLSQCNDELIYFDESNELKMVMRKMMATIVEKKDRAMYDRFGQCLATHAPPPFN